MPVGIHDGDVHRAGRRGGHQPGNGRGVDDDGRRLAAGRQEREQLLSADGDGGGHGGVRRRLIGVGEAGSLDRHLRPARARRRCDGGDGRLGCGRELESVLQRGGQLARVVVRVGIDDRHVDPPVHAGGRVRVDRRAVGGDARDRALPQPRRRAAQAHRRPPTSIPRARWARRPGRHFG